jgi:hypothetical protein
VLRNIYMFSFNHYLTKNTLFLIKYFQMSAKVPQLKAAEAISNLDHLCELDPNAKTAFIRLTGLIWYAFY